MDYQLICAFNEMMGRWDMVLSGEVDIFNAMGMKEDLLTHFTERRADIYLDCKELTYIDSTGLGALAGLLMTVKQYGFNICLTSVKPGILKLFKITNLDSMFAFEGGTDNG